MKIIIELPQLDALADIQSEMDSIDTDLKTLLDAVQAGKQAEPGKPLAVQLQQLLHKAVALANKQPDDTQAYIDRYIEGYSLEVANRVVTSYTRQIGERIETLKRQLNKTIPFVPSSHIAAGQEINRRLGQSAFIDLQQTVHAQVENQLTEALSELDTVTSKSRDTV